MKRKQRIDPLESVLQDYSQRISLTPELSDEQRARAYAEGNRHAPNAVPPLPKSRPSRVVYRVVAAMLIPLVVILFILLPVAPAGPDGLQAGRVAETAPLPLPSQGAAEPAAFQPSTPAPQRLHHPAAQPRALDVEPSATPPATAHPPTPAVQPAVALADSLVLFPSDSMPPSAIPPTINATYASFICSSEVCDTQRFLYHLCLELSLI